MASGKDEESKKFWEQEEERNSRSEFVDGYNSKHLLLRDEYYCKNSTKYNILTTLSQMSHMTSPHAEYSLKICMAWIHLAVD